MLRERIMKHISIFTEKSQEEPEFWKLLLISSAAAIIIFLAQIVTYLIVDAVFTPDPYWLARISETCDIDVKTNRNILNYKSLV
jgi:hypothetical protein